MRKSSARTVVPRQLSIADLGERARHWVDVVSDETTKHPLRTAGIAAGAGFVLGGGLFTPLTARTLRSAIHLALRLAILPALTRGLALMGSRLMDDFEGYGSTTTAEGEKS